MITLKDHRIALHNLPLTIAALENLDDLIENYSVPLPGPAYVIFDSFRTGDTRVQFDRGIMVYALKSQRAKLTEYLETLGIIA